MQLELLTLFQGVPGALPLYQEIEARICAAFDDVHRKVGKTQVSFSNRYGFAYVSLPRKKIKDGPAVVLTFGLAYRLVHPRIMLAVEPYPNRWTHHMLLHAKEELDDEVMGWLREAYDFSMSKRS